MPISFLGSKDFLFKLRNEGLTKNVNFIINYQYTFYEPLSLVANKDLYFNFSPLYEEVRKRFIEEGGISYFCNGLSFLEKVENKADLSRLKKIFMLLNRLIFRMENFMISKFSKIKIIK
jgi:hypothetical protein